MDSRAGLGGGVVTEVGGMLSHAAVIGREYGIPAVLNVAGATSAVRSGQRIRIDGSAGVVRILDADSADAPAGNEPSADRRRAEVDAHAQPEEVAPPTQVHREISTSAANPAPAPRVGRGSGKDTTLTARKRLICLAGGDGSGKTTQVARIAAEFEAQGHSVAAVTIWDAFLDPKVSSKLPWGSPAEIYGYLQLLTPLSRAHFLFHAMQLSLDLAAERGADIVLANAYWYKYYATEVAHGGDPAVLRSLAAGFPEPDRTFYLAVRPQDALSRKRLRSDYESGYGDEESFLAFQQRSHEALDALSDELGWIRLDGTAAQAEITSAVLTQLREDDR
ncbi:dTMP kinase [Nocardia gamkensis]|uniref:dTMP kinase n=1 Tax=Nocardia gamkensis TaxID=352869 RepID=UPI0037C5C664